MASIRVDPCGEREKATWSTPAVRMSSTKFASPVRWRRSSTRAIGCPTQRPPISTPMLGRLLNGSPGQRLGQPAPVVGARVQVMAGLDLLRGGLCGGLGRLSGGEQPLGLAGADRDVADAAEHDARRALARGRAGR